MKNGILILLCIAITATITSCNKNTYVPYEELTFNTENTANSDYVEESTENGEDSNVFDTRKYTEMRIISDNKEEVFVLIDFSPRILNIEKKSYKWLCTKLECDHTENDCVMHERRDWFRVYKNGYLYTKGANLYYQKVNGEKELVFSNSFVSDFEKSMGWDACRTFLFIDENNLLMCGKNYFFTYNINTNTYGEIIEVADVAIFSYCYYEGDVYACLSTGELYRINLNTGEVSYLLEQGYHPKFYEDRIYYCKWYKGVCSIYSNNTEFTDEKLFAENTDAVFSVCEKGIYYTKDTEIFLINFNGEIEFSLGVSDWEYDYDKLPSKYQSDDINRPNAKSNGISNLHYVSGDFVFSVIYDVYTELNQGQFDVYYGVDENGEIFEFTER